jgi:NitT/TauT family transport system substrate-binding protein
MKSRESDRFNVNRRSLVVGTAALGAASLLGVPLADAAEPPPERTRIRLAHVPAICLAPQYLAEELLRLEGFSHIEYVEDESQLEPYGFVATGRADLTMDAATALVPAIDDGRPVVVLAGVHGG